LLLLHRAAAMLWTLSRSALTARTIGSCLGVRAAHSTVFVRTSSQLRVQYCTQESCCCHCHVSLSPAMAPHAEPRQQRA
jgi:hypothetical protein